MSNPYTRLMNGPTECRDLHEILRPDGTPVLPLDHWGHGCPHRADETPTAELPAHMGEWPHGGEGGARPNDPGSELARRGVRGHGLHRPAYQPS